MPTTAKVRTTASAAAVPGAKKRSPSATPARTAVKTSPRTARRTAASAGPEADTGKAKTKSPPKPDATGSSPSALIDARIQELGDWRGEMLARLRALVHEADPEVVEEWKWRGTPVWSHGGLICTGETYKEVVKMTFAKGASVADPSGLFNASLDGNVRRAIDFREGDKPDAKALKALIRAAVALNEDTVRGRAAAKKAPARKASATKTAEAATGTRGQATTKARKPASLPKSDGDAGVQAYIASLSPWQAELARRVDALAVKHVPGLRKGVRWHCPFYGLEGQGWFLAFAAFQRHVKFTFFQGSSLDPAPPLGDGKEARSLDLRESDTLDEKQWKAWLRQAAALPGWDGGATRSGGAAL